MSLLARIMFCAALLVPVPLGAVPEQDAGAHASLFASEARGPHATGTRQELWIDADRAEVWTTDPADKRHLMVQVWYPINEPAPTKGAPYVLSPDLYDEETTKRWVDGPGPALTRSALDAPVSRGARLPLVIYNPGGGNPHFAGTFLTEFLASQGYMVISIGHTGQTGLVRFPDGSTYDQSDAAPTFRLPPDQMQKLGPIEQYQERVRIMASQVLPVQEADIRFVLDRLARMNATKGSPFYQRLDLDHVGAVGFSLGGALALQAARDEPRIKATVNLDGWLYTNVVNTGLHTPVMILHSQPPDNFGDAQWRELSHFALSQVWKTFRQTDADWYDVTIKNTVHRYFSDSMLFSSPEKGYLPPTYIHRITNDYVLDFLDHYLRNRPLQVLALPASPFPEVTALKK